MKKLALLLAVLSAFLAVSTAAGQGKPETLVVDDDLTCDGAAYTTVNAALADASPGDTIELCEGTYEEQVDITIDRITLRARAGEDAVIKAPAPMAGNRSIVEVSGAQKVTIEDLTITGPTPGTCGILSGIRIDGGGSATIEGNHVTAIRDNPISGCQNGVGILVGRDLESTTGTAKIVGNVIDDYQKAGIVVDGDGSSAQITGNTITGGAVLPNIAQNGIQVSRNAAAQVRYNDVDGNWFSGNNWSATGILVFEANGVLVQFNTLDDNQVGIAVESWCWQLPSADNNKVTNNTIDGADWGVSVAAYNLGGLSTCDASADGNHVVNNAITSEDGVAGVSVGSGEFFCPCGAFTPTADNNKVIRNAISGFETPVEDAGTASKVHANVID